MPCGIVVYKIKKIKLQYGCNFIMVINVIDRKIVEIIKIIWVINIIIINIWYRV